MSVIVLLMASGIMIFVGMLIYRKYDGCPSPAVAMAYGAFTLVLFSWLLIGTAMDLAIRMNMGTMGGVFGVCLAFVISLPPVALMGVQISQTIGDVIVRMVFDSSIISPPPSAYGRAQTCTVNGDIAGAIQEYWTYFNAVPSVPAPLFAAAIMLERKSQFEQAAYFYREIMIRFEKTKPVWAEAALRLSRVYGLHLNNPGGEAELLQKVMRRARNFKQGQEAAERVLRRYAL